MENAFKPKATALPPVQTPDDESGAVQPSQTREETDNAATTKFASVLAVLARQAHLIGNGVSNEYLQVGSPIFFSPSDFFFFLAPRWLCLQSLLPLPCIEQGMGQYVWSCGWW